MRKTKFCAWIASRTGECSTFRTMLLREHDVTLQDNDICLRPMTEGDWPLLLKWNSDPEVVYFSDDTAETHSLEEVQDIYRTTSQNAHCFITEYQGHPIGECWLQKMNVRRISDAYPSLDLRRIDLMIGEKGMWDKRIGTRFIRLLVDFGFLHEKADMIFALVSNYNTRSLHVFRKLGFSEHAVVAEAPGSRARFCHELFISKDGLTNNK